MSTRATSAGDARAPLAVPVGRCSVTRAALRIAIRGAWRKGVQMCRLIIGIPDYDTYVEHIRRSHPERVPMTYEAFFIERQQARYRGGGGRCC